MVFSFEFFGFPFLTFLLLFYPQFNSNVTDVDPVEVVRCFSDGASTYGA
jgi:hypothetical protein